MVMAKFTLDLSEAERARFEEIRAQLGKRSLAEVLRHWLAPHPDSIDWPGTARVAAELSATPSRMSAPVTTSGEPIHHKRERPKTTKTPRPK